jgi:phage replication O-like protein O
LIEPREENGYTVVPVDFSNAVTRTNLSAYESRILWFIVRKTFGWHKSTDRVSFTQFEEATGVARAHIGRTLKHLIARRIILCVGAGYKLEYGVQTDYGQWLESLPKEVTNSTKHKTSNYQLRLLPKEVTNKSLPIQGESLPIQDGSLPKEVTKSLPIQVNTKEEITKQSNYTKEQEGSSTPSTLTATTEVSRYLFEKTNRKRWANFVQKEKFEACENQVGVKVMKDAVDWALTRGIADIKSMITTAQKKARGGGIVDGRSPQPSRRSDGPYQRPVAKAHTPEEYERSAENWRRQQDGEG